MQTPFLAFENMVEERESEELPKHPIPKCVAASIIERSVLLRLKLCPYKEMDEVSVSCDGSVLTLRGCVPTYFLKQLAQVIAKNVPDVDIICNECVVLGE
jgi:BON domain